VCQLQIREAVASCRPCQGFQLVEAPTTQQSSLEAVHCNKAICAQAPQEAPDGPQQPVMATLIDKAMLEAAHNADFGSVTTMSQGWRSTGRWEEDAGTGQSI